MPIPSDDMHCILRLIHCLQRERGASCVLAGTRSSTKQNRSRDESKDDARNSLDIDNIRLTRAATNAAIKAFYLNEVADTSSCDVASKLFGVRQSVDQDTYEEETYQCVHTIVKEFSSLISSVIKVHVIDIIAPTFEQGMSPQERESVSLLKVLLSFVELKESLGIERASLTGIMAAANRQMGGMETHDSDDQAEFQEASELDAPGLPFIINDVVMVVENQHRILSELQKQSEATCLDHNLLRLIGDSIKQSDEMQSLQDHIRNDFDMSRFQQVSAVLYLAIYMNYCIV